MASGVSSKIGASGGPENGGTFRKEEALSAVAISRSRDHALSISLSSLLGAAGRVMGWVVDDWEMG